MSWVATRRPATIRATLLAAIAASLAVGSAVMLMPAAGALDTQLARAWHALEDAPTPAEDIIVLEFDSISRAYGMNWHLNPRYWSGLAQTTASSEAAALVIDDSIDVPFWQATVGTTDPAVVGPIAQEAIDNLNAVEVPLVIAARQEDDGSHAVPLRAFAPEGAEEPLSQLESAVVGTVDRGHGQVGRMRTYDLGPARLDTRSGPMDLRAAAIEVLQLMGADPDELEALPASVALRWYPGERPFRTEAVAAATMGVQLDILEDRIVVVSDKLDSEPVHVSTLTSDSHQSGTVLATALSNLLQGTWMHESPRWTALLGGGALAATFWALAVSLAPLASVPTILLVLTGWTMLCWVALQQGVFLPGASALAIGLAGLLGTVLVLVAVAVRERLRIKGMFARYVSPDVVSELADSDDPIRLGGESREISVLFSDIRGFTSLSEHAAPEEMVAELNDYFSQMVEVVTDHGGTLDKFLGDGMMAIFGAPVDQPDHAEQACRAALEMLDRLDALNQARAAAGKNELRIGIGIHTGQAVVGNIGSPLFRVDFTAIGDTVNLASRLEGATKDAGCPVLVSAETRQAVGEALSFTARGSIVVKGRTAATELFEPALEPAPAAATD